MKAQIGWALLWTFLIALVMMVLVFALPIMLRSVGLQEWGTLLNKLMELSKHDEASLYLPTYVSSVSIFHGEGGECKDMRCRSMCKDSSGRPLEGETFITVNLNPNSRPSTISVLWKFATFRVDKAKADAAQMAVSEMCLPMAYESSFETAKYVERNALVLGGDESNPKSYCIRIERRTGVTSIHVVSESKCTQFASETIRSG